MNHGTGCCPALAEWLKVQFRDKSRGICDAADVLHDVPGGSPVDPLKVRLPALVGGDPTLWHEAFAATTDGGSL